MNNKTKLKLNIKSKRGFTTTDLVIALVVFSILTATVGAMFYNVYKQKLTLQLSSNLPLYMVKMAEDIDKISYEDVTEELANTYKTKFSIPEGYNLNIEISNYNSMYGNADLIKIAKITISYTFNGQTQNLVVNKMKVRELE